MNGAHLPPPLDVGRWTLNVGRFFLFLFLFLFLSRYLFVFLPIEGYRVEQIRGRGRGENPESTGLEPATSAVTGRRSNQLS